MQTLTQSAQRLAPIQKRGGEESFSANAAQTSGERTERFQTCFTNGKPRNANQRGVTDTAIGGKKRKK